MAKQPNVISHWYQLVEAFQTSPLIFYKELEAALDSRMVPEMKGTRVEFKEGGLLSAHREYLHIVRGRYSFDICAAPFGTGFFFSWWLTEPQSRFGLLYLLGFLLAADIVGALALGVGIPMFGFLKGLVFSMLCALAALWAFGYGVREGMIDMEDIVLQTPIIGRLYEIVFSPPTYYKIDTALMFQQTVHNSVLEVIDTMTAAKGIRVLSENERKPILKAFAKSA